MGLVDEILELIHSFAPNFDFNFNKYFIGLKKGDQVLNFITLEPLKESLRLNLKTERNADLENEMTKNGIKFLNYDQYFGQYPVKIYPEWSENQKEIVKGLLSKFYQNSYISEF